MTKDRVFIVEDEETALTSLKRLLVLSGFEAEGTVEPKDAVSMIKSFKPDIILLDLLMSGIGGFEICEMLNSDQETQGIPIIVLSGLDKPADIKQAYKLGVVDYFIKPFEYPQLVNQIKKFIRYKKLP